MSLAYVLMKIRYGVYGGTMACTACGHQNHPNTDGGCQAEVMDGLCTEICACVEDKATEGVSSPLCEKHHVLRCRECEPHPSIPVTARCTARNPYGDHRQCQLNAGHAEPHTRYAGTPEQVSWDWNRDLEAYTATTPMRPDKDPKFEPSPVLEGWQRRVEAVDHPAHYGGADNPYEHVKVVRAWGLNYELGNATKYICRYQKKDPAKAVEDLKKAIFYIEAEIKRITE